jgi:glycosyltransferase involved in cell wall biosynthesis
MAATRPGESRLKKTVAVIYSGARVWGGIETYLSDLFHNADPEAIRLVLVSMGEWELNRTGIPAESQRFLSGRRARPKTVLDIRRILREEGADLVVSQGAVANAYARMAALLAGRPSLVVTHSELKTDYPRALKRLGFTAMDRLLRPITKHYVAVSEYLRSGLIASGVKADAITVVYNGVDIERGAGGESGVGPGPEMGAENGARPSAAERVLPTGEAGMQHVVSIGRLHAVKNFDALIRAMGLLPDGIRLTIWGDGDERDRLRALIESLGLDERAQLAGTATSVPEVLEEADVYVQPSRSEGFGLAVVEAMLCCKPVVVAPCGSLTELVEHEVTGVVAADGSPEALAASVHRVLGDEPFASKIAFAGQQAARERFSVDRWIEGTVAAFLAACARR